MAIEPLIIVINFKASQYICGTYFVLVLDFIEGTNSLSCMNYVSIIAVNSTNGGEEERI
jgi:hypothetical protein